MDSALRPRDIQARIRAGESAEDVAAAAQTTVEKIMPFAGPVLAERAHVAQNALKASVRRRGGDPSAARTLGDAADLYFATHTLHDEDVTWDAWRRPDGRWALVAEYAVSGQPRTAEFTHDLPGRYVLAENDEARFLTGERRPEPTGEAPARRLTALPERIAPLDLHDELGDDALEMVREEPSGAEAAAPLGGTADADWLVDGAAPVQEPTSAEEQPVEAEPAAESPARVEHDEDELPFEEPVARRTEAQPEQPADEDKPAKGSRRRKGRSSVPSWDEIMFGGSPGE